MFDQETLVKTDRVPGPEPQRAPTTLRAESPRKASPYSSPYYDPQRRMMTAALALLLVALGFVVYKNRTFWFPETPDQEAEYDEPAATGSAPTTTSARSPAAAAMPGGRARHTVAAAHRGDPKPSAPNSAKSSSVTPELDASSAEGDPIAATATATRTVLPPLEVEVVAGDSHRTMRPGSNSVRVDLEPGAPTQNTTQPTVQTGASDSAAKITRNAAERVQISADTAEAVNNPVRPAYPLLARQAKVEGSVILQALISKDGAIQDLHVVSGPPILASAAQTAVRQWRFKPHFQGAEAVETQAKITVNFTISTN